MGCMYIFLDIYAKLYAKSYAKSYAKLYAKSYAKLYNALSVITHVHLILLRTLSCSTIFFHCMGFYFTGVYDAKIYYGVPERTLVLKGRGAYIY